MKIIALISVCITLAACGTVTRTSGVQSLGPDTFTVTSDDLSPSKARGHALSQARQHCDGMRRELLVLDMRSTGQDFGRQISTVQFRCLVAGDPELNRPTYRRAPDVLIEDSRK